MTFGTHEQWVQEYTDALNGNKKVHVWSGVVGGRPCDWMYDVVELAHIEVDPRTPTLQTDVSDGISEQFFNSAQMVYRGTASQDELAAKLVSRFLDEDDLTATGEPILSGISKRGDAERMHWKRSFADPVTRRVGQIAALRSGEAGVPVLRVTYLHPVDLDSFEMPIARADTLFDALLELDDDTRAKALVRQDAITLPITS